MVINWVHSLGVVVAIALFTVALQTAADDDVFKSADGRPRRKLKWLKGIGADPALKHIYTKTGSGRAYLVWRPLVTLPMC